MSKKSSATQFKICPVCRTKQILNLKGKIVPHLRPGKFIACRGAGK